VNSTSPKSTPEGAPSTNANSPTKGRGKLVTRVEGRQRAKAPLPFARALKPPPQTPSAKQGYPRLVLAVPEKPRPNAGFPSRSTHNVGFLSIDRIAKDPKNQPPRCPQGQKRHPQRAPPPTPADTSGRRDPLPKGSSHPGLQEKTTSNPARGFTPPSTANTRACSSTDGDLHLILQNPDVKTLASRKAQRQGLITTHHAAMAPWITEKKPTLPDKTTGPGSSDWRRPRSAARR
jgi:hypothetical protein